MLSVGYQISWPSPSMPQLLAKDSDIPITSSQNSWIVAFQQIGGIPGTVFGSFIVDRWGRKTSLLLMSIPLCISCVIIAFANTYWWLYIGRSVSVLRMISSFAHRTQVIIKLKKVHRWIRSIKRYDDYPNVHE